MQLYLSTQISQCKAVSYTHLDEEIGPDDVIQEEKGLTKEEKEELMAPVDAEPDPDFDTAMTFEDINLSLIHICPKSDSCCQQAHTMS